MSKINKESYPGENTIRKYFSAKELRVSEHRFNLLVEKQRLSEDLQK